MIVTTMNDIPGYEIDEVYGEVFGLTVRSRNLGSQFGASLKSMLGGELKGLTISFHFRELADEAAAVRELETIAARATDEGFVARFGRKVLEVLPPIGSNKGTAVRHLLEGAGVTRALVAGDDTTDIDSFRAVDGMENAVRVAVVSSESPTVLREYADIVVESTTEFLELLRRL